MIIRNLRIGINKMILSEIKSVLMSGFILELEKNCFNCTEVEFFFKDSNNHLNSDVFFNLKKIYTQYRNIRNGGVFPVLGLFLKFPIFSLLRFLSLTRSFLKFFKIFTLVS